MADLESRVRSALAGRYDVKERLGTGASAEVFRAHDTKLDRDVAVKVLRPQVALMLGPDRFLREIRLAASLQHPHILPVYDSGEADGLLYYVTPVVSDTSLREHMKDAGPLPLDEAVRIAREVGSALDYAHSHGVVHRDIKPGNILLTEGGALVADFGIARPLAQDDGARLTESGFVVGTPAYMSPEQAYGSEEVGPESDIYSLGCVAYEMLSTRLPFDASNPRMMAARHATETVPPLRTIRKDIPVRVDRAVLRAMSKEPTARYPSGAAFAEALTAMRGPGEKISGLVRASRARRVPRALAVYAVIGLVAVLATDWAVNRYLLSHHLTQLVIATLLLLVPAACISWYYRSRLRRAAAPLGVNFCIAGVVLIGLFAGEDLGRTVTARQVVTEAGGVETRLVPKATFRHRIAFFPFLPERSEEPEPDAQADAAWLGTGIPLLLQHKLLQDPFFEVRTGFRTDLRRAEHPDSVPVPPLLQERIARQNGFDYVLTGTYAAASEGIRADFELRDVARNRPVANFDLSAPSLTALSDSAAERLRGVLPLPSGWHERIRDLPTADLLTHSPEALRAWVLATERTEMGEDYGAAVPLLRQAVALDSGFAVASAHLFGAYVGTNQLDLAREAAENARRHRYRLTEVHELNFLQGYWIVVEGDWRRAAGVAERQIGLAPDNVEKRTRFAKIRWRYADTASAAAHYDTALTQDPRYKIAIDGLADLRLAEGNLDEAIRIYEDHLYHVPDDRDDRLAIGNAYLSFGWLDQAEETFESVRLELPRDSRPFLALGTVARRRGDVDWAADLFDSALAASRLAGDSAEVRLAQVDLAIERGSLSRALTRLWQVFALSAASEYPNERRAEILRAAAKLGGAAGTEETRALLDSLAAELRSPMLVDREAGLVLFYSAAGPADSLRSAVLRLEREADMIGPFDWRGLIEFGWAEHDRQTGNCEGSLPRYQRALEVRFDDRGPAYRGRADCLHAVGRTTDAVSALETALEWSASDAAAHLSLARLLLGSGDLEAARSHLDESLRLWSSADSAFVPAGEARALRASLGDGPR